MPMRDIPRAVAAAFFLSGAAALVYETVWLRMLTRAFGVTAHAAAALVALFMGGLALGAALSRRLPARSWPRVYAALEAAAALSAVAGTAAVLRLPELVSSLGASAPLSPWTRALLAAPAVLPSTILLGATLPVLARGVESAGAVSWLSRLYAVNALGACAGTLAAAFVLIGALGEKATVGFAVALNLAAAGLALTVPAGRAPASAPVVPAGRAPWRAMALYGVSGFCALGYEVLWARQLTPLLGNSVYAFALLLCAYLLGLAAGSRKGASGPALSGFGLWQAALGAAVLLSLLAFEKLGLAASSHDFLYSPIRSGSDFLWLAAEALLLVFPASYCMGRLFPLAAALALEEGAAAPEAAGALYAANTVGGVLGSLAAGFWAIEALGVHRAFQALTALTFLVAGWSLRRSGWRPRDSARAGLAAAAVMLLAASTSSDPMVEILRRRLDALLGPGSKVVFHDEAAAATVTGYEKGPLRGILINGIDTAGVGIPGTLMAVMPHYLIEKPSSTLVICFGAGNTFRTASQLGAGPVDAVDLVPTLFERMRHFYADADEYLSKPGNRVIAEDGRQWLLRGTRRYDSIIVDAAPPLFSAGAVNLYTVEFFRLADRSLSEQGMLTLWLPLPSFEEDYWRVLSALTAVFPHAAAWRFASLPGFLVFASRRPLSWPEGELARRLKARPSFYTKGATEASLRQGFVSDEAGLRARASRYPPLTDDKPVVEFPLPRFLRGAAFVRTPDFLQ